MTGVWKNETNTRAKRKKGNCNWWGCQPIQEVRKQMEEQTCPWTRGDSWARQATDENPGKVFCRTLPCSLPEAPGTAKGRGKARWCLKVAVRPSRILTLCHINTSTESDGTQSYGMNVLWGQEGKEMVNAGSLRTKSLSLSLTLIIQNITI